jgi:hypothetical protein
VAQNCRCLDCMQAWKGSRQAPWWNALGKRGLPMYLSFLLSLHNCNYVKDKKGKNDLSLSLSLSLSSLHIDICMTSNVFKASCKLLTCRFTCKWLLNCKSLWYLPCWVLEVDALELSRPHYWIGVWCDNNS